MIVALRPAVEIPPEIYERLTEVHNSNRGYLQDKDFDLYHVSGKEEHRFVPYVLSRLCVNNIPPPPT
jgi:hypothetical protein